MTDRPIRIQLSRRKGWKMPDNTVKVDRSTKYGNRHRIGENGIETNEDAVAAFRGDVTIGLVPDASDLRGKNIGCWCAIGQPCHGDVWLEIANADPVTP